MLLHVFLFTMYQSVCQWNLFDAYLSLLAKEKGFQNSNTWVGFAEGISGLTTLLLAVPLGLLADHTSRTRLIHCAGWIGIVASLVTAYAFAFDHLVTLYTNLVLWGLFLGLQGTAAEAVFADSVENGERSQKFMWKGVLNTCGLSLGPLLMLGLFAIFGNNWGLQQLHLPLLVGCCFAPLACLPLFFMYDPMETTEKKRMSNTISSPESTLQTPLLDPMVPLSPRRPYPAAGLTPESPHVGVCLPPSPRRFSDESGGGAPGRHYEEDGDEEQRFQSMRPGER